MHDDTTRLNKHLALQLGVSRREADELIEQGKVLVDGSVVSLGARISKTSVVTLDSKPVQTDTARELYLLHKPVGYVCSRRAQGDNPTIYDLLPPELRTMKPVGRLDKDSSGLILLTNDGDLAHSMTHPKFKKTKVYEVRLDHPLQPLHQQMISDHGIALEDGGSQFVVTRIEHTPADIVSRPLSHGGKSVEQPDFPGITGENLRETPPAKDGLETISGPDEPETYQITMAEGRNRQIRRTFASLGYSVTHLHRTQFGPYSLGSTAVGQIKKTMPV